MDYSSYITIDNQLSCSLTLVNYGTNSGYWEKSPPKSIGGETKSAQFQVKDYWGPYGSDGWVQYRAELDDAPRNDVKPIILIKFSCPTGANDNEFSASATAGSDPGAAQCNLFSFRNTDYPKRDHPLTVTVTITFNNRLLTASSVSSIKAPRPVTRMRNTKGVINFANNMVVWDIKSPATYEDDSEEGRAGSFFPVAIDVQDSSLAARALDLVVTVDSGILGVPVTLHGGNDVSVDVAASDETRVFTKSGTYQVRVTVSPSWASSDEPWGVVGNVVWRFAVPSTGQMLPLNATRLEYYALTRKLPRFFSQSVPVMLAWRFVPLAPSREHWLDHCYEKAFFRFGFRYDAVRGAPSYIRSELGGPFKLASYLQDIETGSASVNCYDQAGIMQISLALGPQTADMQWAYMRPYGFIKTTNLVGWGQCNNPFFQAPSRAPQQVCDNDDPRRTWFGNHAFLIQRAAHTVVDATCSPHRGDESLDRYLRAAIQTTDETTLYARNGIRPGDESSLDTSSSGVSSIYSATMPQRRAVGSPGFGHGYDAPVSELLRLAEPLDRKPPEPKYCSDADAGAVFAAPDSAWEVLRADTYMTDGVTAAEWVLRDKSGGGAHVVDALHGHLAHAAKDETVVPRILDVLGPDQVRVGEDFIVRVSAEGRPRVAVRSDSANVVLLEANDSVLTYKFSAVEPGDDTIHFHFAHATSLMPAARSHQLTVVE
ncbi:hypothetical protein DIS24_g11239 [Lasiodiplodia hormozganensis]|uniref:Uncharacterized protein n=1 Tax=Lasiodiplodia hormozganensis TaxID=869390 RepID=A0AA39WV92_9PEZI|nr:hypothetical protein DIS24_g11239 [Lasiodiplodia hormozganensis]